MPTTGQWLLNTVTSRVEEGPEGLGGGAPGAPGKFHINGKSVRDAKKLTMQPADVVLFETPGGGAYGTPPNQLIAYLSASRQDREIMTRSITTRVRGALLK
jgi:N-methylhydantoinase B